MQSSCLQGQTILITRAASMNSVFRNMLEEKGATVLDLPALVIKEPSSWQEFDRAIDELDTFSWLILTSANGVEYFLQRLQQLNKSIADLKHIKIAVVGKKTAKYLRKHNLEPDFIPPDFVADSLVEHFPEALAGQKILFPRVESGGRKVLVKELSAQNAIVVEVAGYQSTCPKKIDRDVWYALLKQQVDVITFASSKTVKNFCSLVNQALTEYSDITLESLLKNVKIASIGPQTSITCHEQFQRVDIEAKEYTLDGLSEAIVNYNQSTSVT